MRPGIIGKIKENRMKRKFIIILCSLIVVSSHTKAQSCKFRFRQLQTDNICMKQLMHNIIVACDVLLPNAKCHYLTININRTDTLLEIHSYDNSGIYTQLSTDNILGVIQEQGVEFYIDVSLYYLFYPTNQYLKKKYNKEQLFMIHQSIAFNDCYLFWQFQKTKWGLKLTSSCITSLYEYWYNMDLNHGCFFDYKNLTIEIIDEVPIEWDDTIPSSNH